MDKLIQDLNLTALEQNGDKLTKVSSSPDHSPSPGNICINDDIFCVDERLNRHLEKGYKQTLNCHRLFRFHVVLTKPSFISIFSMEK